MQQIIAIINPLNLIVTMVTIKIVLSYKAQKMSLSDISLYFQQILKLERVSMK